MTTEKQKAARVRNHYVMRLRRAYSIAKGLRNAGLVSADDANALRESIDQCLRALGAETMRERDQKLMKQLEGLAFS